MLPQLISKLHDLPSVTDKLLAIEAQAKKIPTTPEELIALLGLCRFKLNDKEYPVIRQTDIFVSFLECKQILVATEDYFYI